MGGGGGQRKEANTFSLSIVYEKKILFSYFLSETQNFGPMLKKVMAGSL